MSAHLETRGLRELHEAMVAAGAGLPRAARVALTGALDVVVDYARPRIPTRTGAARASLSTQVTEQQATVTAGGGRAPYFGWLDYGGRVGRDAATVRRWEPGGRYLYPGLRRGEPQITAAAQRALDALVERSGLDVT